MTGRSMLCFVVPRAGHERVMHALINALPSGSRASFWVQAPMTAAELGAERALADDLAAVLTRLEAVLHPDHPEVSRVLARYREARGL